MNTLKERSFIQRHRLISFFRDIDVTGFRRLSVLLPKLLLPSADKLGRFILRTPMGFKMIIDPSTDNGVEESLYSTGTYEKGILEFISSNFKEDGHFVDVGANIGLMSIYVAHAFPGSKITSFEAHPDNFNSLQQNLTLNYIKSVDYRQLAIGASEGVVKIFNDDENRGGASVKHGSGTGFDVRMSTLDQELKDTPIDLIKVDVEGMELEVLQGAKELIQTYKPILIIEVSINREKQNESEAIFSFIKEIDGYRIYKLKGTKERCSDLVIVDKIGDLPEHDNIICIAS